MSTTKRYTNEQLISVEDARQVVFEHLTRSSTERIPLTEAFGRVLAQDVSSDIDISPFDNSAMDGFAVRFADFEAARGGLPLQMPIAGHVAAGEVFEGVLQPGQAVRIMTGAPMPEGADTVVKIEDTEVLGESAENASGEQVVFAKTPQYGANVRMHGEEAKAGEVLLRCGERLNAAGVGLLASTGNSTVSVYRRPTVAIFSTGTELVGCDQVPGPGQIRNSNSYSLAAQVLETGAIPVIMPAVGDTREELQAALLSAVDAGDFVLSSGGAAEGDFDFITPAVREQGELFFNKVNMKPGKAQTFGVVRGVPFLGLPGNPGAAAVGFEIFARPALRWMQGYPELDRQFVQARMATDVHKRNETRRLYLRATLTRDAAGEYLVSPDRNQSSALLGVLNRSNCLLIVPEGPDSLLSGQTASCLRLDMEQAVV
ncbi:MAG: molybdopterin molybdotransferase MoeA [Coriobacteriales bacterium]|jgi:molybdopterin molybdotransferase|nr:molybdopterin molybdotransferase MoeA [Coriobacteriales bacterium]